MGYGKHAHMSKGPKMGHSPNEMGHSPNEMSRELEYMPAVEDMTGQRASSIINAGARSRMGGQPQMKGSPYHNEDPPKGKEKNTSGIFGGDTIMGDENKDGTMLSRGFNTAREYMKRNFPIEGRTTSLTRPYRDFSEGIDTSGDWNDKFKMETGRTKKPIGKMD